MNLRYRVALDKSEQQALAAMLSGSKHAARKLKRAQILLAAHAGGEDASIAATLAASESTVYRTKRRFVEWGLEAALAEQTRPGAQRKLSGKVRLISKRRGVPSNRRIDLAVQQHYVALVREHYADFGPQLACEYLTREHGLTHSSETLRGWMQGAGLWQAKRRRVPPQHSPRARRNCVGELVQIDGSHHAWFERRAAKCCLIAFIDDATGRVQAARFCQAETMQDYFAVLRQYVQQHGLPGFSGPGRQRPRGG